MRVTRGSQSGMFMRSSGSGWPSFSRKIAVSARICSPSALISPEKRVSDRIRKASFDIAGARSMRSPSASVSAKRSLVSRMASPKPATWRGLNMGAMARRALRHTSPSAVSMPSRSA